MPQKFMRIELIAQKHGGIVIALGLNSLNLEDGQPCLRNVVGVM